MPFSPHAPLINAVQNAWASPIDYTQASDGSLLVGTVMVIVLLALEAGLGIYALKKYRRRRKETGKGWPTWAVVLTVLAIIVFWTVVFMRFVSGEGARYIG